MRIPARRLLVLSMGFGILNLGAPCVFAANSLPDETASAEQAPGAPETPAQRDAGPISAELLNLRDPFRRPQTEAKKIAPKNELEQYAVESFKMVGVLTGPDRVRAMLKTPSGKTVFVSEKMKIGLRRGFVRKITGTSVLVREKVTNILGQDELIDSEIQLMTDTKLREHDSASLSNPGTAPQEEKKAPGSSFTQ